MFQPLPSQFHVIFDKTSLVPYEYEYELSFRKFICHSQKETDWKMVRDITFENF